MCARNLTIAFAFEIKLTGGNNHTGEIIVVTSDTLRSLLSFPALVGLQVPDFFE
jgi:hypothetical protein